MTRRSRRIAIAAAVLPLVVLVGLRAAWAAYACSVDGEVRATCCCPKPAARDQPRDAQPHVRARCCCDVTQGETAPAPDTRTDRGDATGAPLLIPAVAYAPVAPAHAVRVVPEAAAARPPPAAIPIYLANRTFLL